MNERDYDSPEESRIDREAADWVAKQVRELTAEEQDSFFDWLALDPRHSEWHGFHVKTWKRLNQLAEWRPEHGSRPNLDLLRPGRTRRRWFGWVGVAAAVLAVGFSLGIVLNRQSEVGQGAWDFASSEAYEKYLLVDGSVIELKKGASVSVHFSQFERRVELVSDEAHFSVAKDSSRPFVVVAGDVEVKAVGTAFSVDMSNASITVLVTEGKVSMSAPSIPAEKFAEIAKNGLVAGQMTVLSRNKEAGTVSVAKPSMREIDELLSWKPVLLEFDLAPLGEVVKVFNELGETQIVIRDFELGRIPIAASFRVANAEHLVELLELTFPLRSQRLEQGTIELYKN